MTRVPALRVADLTKTFGRATALDHLHLEIQPGEVRALLGENGSGKSTFIKLLSGFHDPDPGGSVEVDGHSVKFGSADSSYARGCRFVHQDLGLVDSLSVLDNLNLSSGFPTRLGTVSSRRAIREAKLDLARVGLDAIDPRTLVGALAPAEKTGVAVARALHADPTTPVKLLVLDEPTATLPDSEVIRFLRIVRQVAESGVGVLYVTHRLDEVFEVADNVSVLRDGRLVATEPTERLDRATLIDLLLGAELEELNAIVDHLHADTRTVLDVQGLSAGPLLDVSLSVRAGEIVGIAGITGSGRESILSAVFGATPRDGGQVEVAGVALEPGRPDKSMARGVAYVPPDRKLFAGVMDLSARENLSLTDLTPFWRGLRIRRKAERAETNAWFERLDIRPSGAIESPLMTFSGGNQQKVILAKWLRRKPTVFLLDEPTQGVDIGAKTHIHRLLVDAASEGAAVVVSSTDVDELAALCHRVIVLRDGRIVNELAGGDATVSTIARQCLGTQREVIAS